MKNKLIGSWMTATVVTAACLVGGVSCASAQPSGAATAAPQTAPLETTVALPPDIAPDSPLGQVVKLVQAGVEPGVIKTFINNCGSAFNLNAEKIIAMTDLGVPTELVNAMMDHDKRIYAAANLPPPSAPAPVPANVEVNPAIVAPEAPVTVEYFNNTLSPYGSWVTVEGYGRCWRPTTVIYDPTWQPYCDRGHWVYSDSGWYWDSDYSWGATFHYGRWFRHDRFGWCWWPDTVWGPSWVTWRQSDAYCGWAPLPPFAVYRPGAGFFYRGTGVAVGFDFGLSASCFTFVSVGNFCDRHPRYFREDSHRRDEIFRQTTVINNYHDNRTTVFNGGISVDRVRGVTHRPLEPVAVRELPNAARQGFRDNNSEHADRRPPHISPVETHGRGDAQGGQVRRDSFPPSDRNNNADRRPGPGQPNALPNRNENINGPGRVLSSDTLGNRGGNDHLQTPINRNPQPAPIVPPHNGPGQSVPPPSNNRPTPGTPFVQNPLVTPSVPARSQPLDNARQDRSFQTPVVRTEPARFIPPIQPRQVITPPSVPTPTPSAPRFVAPPSPPSQPPPQSPPHNSGPVPSHGSDKDKQNH